MFSAGKTVTFSAAHHLPQLPEDHKCHNPHGHNYEVEVELSAEQLDERHFVEDYTVISNLIRNYDHKDLNDFFEMPTAEELAKFFFLALQAEIRPGAKVLYVMVKETEDSWASFSRE